MHLKNLRIKNLFSFKDAEFLFDKYNVIVGANNSGKTNLIRILKLFNQDNSLEYLRINKKIKLDQNETSTLSFNLELTDEETKLVLQTMFNTEIKLIHFPEQIRNITITINWNDVLNDEPTNNFVAYYFHNGLTIIRKDSSQITFDVNNLPGKPDIKNILDEVADLSINLVIQKIHEKFEMSGDHNIGINHIFLESMLSGKSISPYFTTEGMNRWTTVKGEISYDSRTPTKHASEIIDYVKMKKQSTISVQFSYLLIIMIKNNLILLEEIQPTYDILTQKIFELKSKKERTYVKLQTEFSEIFDGISIRVDEIGMANGQPLRKILLTENGREFELEESASGHFALIHILHEILNKPNQILVMDEPEVHFHPIKITQLTQKLRDLSESSNNQIIVISHSSKFIDYKTLDQKRHNILTSINKMGNYSQVQSTPSNFEIHLKSHLFYPEIFFGKCTLMGEGAGDEFALRAISNYFGGIFEKYNITLIQCWGVDNVYPYIEIHKAYKIPYVAMVDKEYVKDQENVIKLSDNLEAEYKKLGWNGTGKLKEDAYSFMENLLQQNDGLTKLKNTDIWLAFHKVIEKVGGKIPQ